MVWLGRHLKIIQIQPSAMCSLSRQCCLPPALLSHMAWKSFWRLKLRKLTGSQETRPLNVCAGFQSPNQLNRKSCFLVWLVSIPRFSALGYEVSKDRSEKGAKGEVCREAVSKPAKTDMKKGMCVERQPPACPRSVIIKKAFMWSQPS